MLTSLRFLILFLFFTATVPTTGSQRSNAHSWVSQRSDVLYSYDGSPSTSLVRLLNAFEVSHTGTWESILLETQKKWIQRGERWTFCPTADASPETSYALFSTLKMTGPFYAKHCDYQYGVVLGALLCRVRARLDFLKKEWERGVRFQKIVFLTGDRPLDPQLEGKEQLKNSPFAVRPGWKMPTELPQNETEMMHFVYEQMDLPTEWAQLPLIVIDTPPRCGKRRPHTEDTFIQWIKEEPSLSGRLLIISNQPFVGRQDTIAHQYLPKSASIETVGPGFTLCEYQKEPLALSILLDELARWIYQESI